MSSHSFRISPGVCGKGVAMDSITYHPGPPCPTLLHPVGRPPLNWSYGRLWSGGRAACGLLLPPWTPHATRVCIPSAFHDFITGQTFAHHRVLQAEGGSSQDKSCTTTLRSFSPGVSIPMTFCQVGGRWLPPGWLHIMNVHPKSCCSSLFCSLPCKYPPAISHCLVEKEWDGHPQGGGIP
jgi:hypothetical protein